MPLISVLLPVYNGSTTITDAVSSIVNQTFTDFELLIIDDGSTDDTMERLDRFDDRRIRVISMSSNVGIAHALNRGLDEAQGALIARMDGDDWSYPSRFQTQVEHFRADPSLGICGTFVVTDGRRPVRWTMPCRDDHIRARLLFASSFYHPTVMMRRSTIDEHHLRYEPEDVPAEDYSLWSRFAEAPSVTMLNIPEVLVRYHFRRNTRVEYERRQRETGIMISEQCASRYGLLVEAGDTVLWRALSGERAIESVDLKTLSAFCKSVIERNDVSRSRIPVAALRRQILWQWYRLGEGEGEGTEARSRRSLRRAPEEGSTGSTPAVRSTTRSPGDGRHWPAHLVSYSAGRLVGLAKTSSRLRSLIGIARQGRVVVTPLRRIARRLESFVHRIR